MLATVLLLISEIISNGNNGVTRGGKLRRRLSCVSRHLDASYRRAIAMPNRHSNE